MHLKEFSYQRQKFKHGLVPIKTHPRTEGAQTTLCFTSLPQYCCSQPPGNGFVSPHCVCSVYQKQIRLFFLPLSVFLLFSVLFLKVCMHVIVQSALIDQTDTSVCPPAAGFPLPPGHDASLTFYKLSYKEIAMSHLHALAIPIQKGSRLIWLHACKCMCEDVMRRETEQSAGLLSGKTARHLSCESLMDGIRRPSVHGLEPCMDALVIQMIQLNQPLLADWKSIL